MRRYAENYGPSVAFQFAEGSFASPETAENGDEIMGFGIAMYDGATFPEAANIVANVAT